MVLDKQGKTNNRSNSIAETGKNNPASLNRSRQLITRGHIEKLLEQSQNNWENFMYQKRNRSTHDGRNLNSSGYVDPFANLGHSNELVSRDKMMTPLPGIDSATQGSLGPKFNSLYSTDHKNGSIEARRNIAI